jgi:hypothetical protein
MKKLVAMLRTGPVIVGEFRGGKGETAKRFDKTDKNAPPLKLSKYKMNLEMLADGSPVMVTVFLDKGTNAEEFGSKVQIKRGDIVAVAVNKLEMKTGFVGRRAGRQISPSWINRKWTSFAADSLSDARCVKG